MTRVCIKNKKWPEIQIRNLAGDWSTMPDMIFEPARAEYNKRSKEEAEKRKARKAAKGARPKTVPMDTTGSSQMGNLRQPPQDTLAKIRSSKNSK